MLERGHYVLTEVTVKDLIESIRRFLHSFTILDLIVLGSQLFYHFVRTDPGGRRRYLVCIICCYGMRKLLEERSLIILVLLTLVTLCLALFQVLSQPTQIRGVQNERLRGFVMPAPISLLHVIVATLGSEAIFADLVLLLWILLLLLLKVSDWLEGIR
jgi:hypothetical protein